MSSQVKLDRHALDDLLVRLNAVFSCFRTRCSQCETAQTSKEHRAEVIGDIFAHFLFPVCHADTFPAERLPCDSSLDARRVVCPNTFRESEASTNSGLVIDPSEAMRLGPNLATWTTINYPVSFLRIVLAARYLWPVG